MVKKLLVLLLFFYCPQLFAETIKTDVLVIGNSPGGISAAIQCARSKLKTTLVIPGAWLTAGIPGGNHIITTNHNIPTGIWGEFQNKVIDFYKGTTGYDAPQNATLKFEATTGADILKSIADTVKNLTIRLNTPFTSIKKDGTGWEVTSTVNGISSVIDAKVVIDATQKGEVVAKAGATFPKMYDYVVADGANMYRTSIATSSVLPKGYIPMKDVMVKDADNLLVVERILPIGRDIQYLPLQMALGQGVGTIAAYAAFFKTTTKKVRVRLVQQELLDFKGYLLPFVDVKADNRYRRVVQQIAATGLLKGEPVKDGLLFNPDAKVTTEEIKPVLTEIYTRAFLWFNKEKPAAQFTIGNLVSLMSEMTLSEPQTLQVNMRNDWNGKYHFTSSFDVNRPVTRMEFAVLVNQFLNPFARTVDLEGNIVN